MTTSMISNIYNKLPSVNAENVKSWVTNAHEGALKYRVYSLAARVIGGLSAMFMSALAFGGNQIKTGAVSLWTLPPAGKVGVGLIVAAALYAAKNCPVKCCKASRVPSSETELPNVNVTASGNAKNVKVTPGPVPVVTEEHKAE